MTPDSTIRIPNRLHALAATAMLLERLEQTPRSASADQYRGLVHQLGALMDEAEGEPGLLPLLENLPSLAELHENRHYAHAGLCRSPLVAVAESERKTLEWMARLRRQS